MSNYLCKTPVTNCKWWDKKNKEMLSIDRPDSITVYNKFMGGVDKIDMMLAIYRTCFRTRKWYRRFVTQFFTQTCVNSWMVHRSLHREINNSLTYLEFLVNKVKCVLGGLHTPDSDDSDVEDLVHTRNSEKIVRAKNIPFTIRYDWYDHWPVYCKMKNAARCKLETGKTMFRCSKCKVYLCVVKSEFFNEFHCPDKQ